MCWLRFLLFVFRSSATYFASSLRKTLMKFFLLFVLRIALRRSSSVKLQSNWRSCYPGTEMIFLGNLNPQRWAKSLEILLRKSSVWSDTHLTYRWSEMLSWVKFVEPVKLGILSCVQRPATTAILGRKRLLKNAVVYDIKLFFQL